MGFAPPFAKYIDLDQISIYEEMFVYHVSFSVRRISSLIKKVMLFEMFIETNK